MKKMFIACAMWICLLSLFVTAGYAQEETKSVSVYVDNEKFVSQNEPFLQNGVTMVPLREFSKMLAGDAPVSIEWDEAAMKAELSCSLDGGSIVMTVTDGGQYVLANGRVLYHTEACRIVDDVMYIPLRTLTKIFCDYVIWDESVMTVYVTRGGGVIEDGASYYDAEDLLWLSRIIHAESRGEPLNGKIAVGNVVLNRAESDEFPDTVYGVIFDKKYGVQFTPAASDLIYNDPTAESVLAAKICLDGFSFSDAILYFLNESIATNFWIPENRDYFMTIGCHDFYT